MSGKVVLALLVLATNCAEAAHSGEKPGFQSEESQILALNVHAFQARPPSTWPPCDGSDADPWVGELRDRLMSFNQLAHYAVERHGPPLTCEGLVATEFDGAKFGAVRLRFAEEVTFQFETMPPEISIAILRTSSGFDDEESVRQLLQTYSTKVGLAIDWTAPKVTMEGDERVQTFWDPVAGLNGSASLIFFNGRLTALRFSVAP